MIQSAFCQCSQSNSGSYISLTRLHGRISLPAHELPPTTQLPDPAEDRLTALIFTAIENRFNVIHNSVHSRDQSVIGSFGRHINPVFLQQLVGIA